MKPQKPVIKDYLAENKDTLETSHPAGMKHFRVALILIGVFLIPSVKADSNAFTDLYIKLITVGPLLYFLMSAYGKKPSAIKFIKQIVLFGGVIWLILLLLMGGAHFGYFGSVKDTALAKHFYSNLFDLGARTLVLIYAFWALFISRQVKQYLANA